MKRREFLTKAGWLAGACPVVARSVAIFDRPAASTRQSDTQPTPQISFETSDAEYQATYSRAMDVLARNTTVVSGYSRPVLIEGSSYSGIWLECAPHEG